MKPINSQTISQVIHEMAQHTSLKIVMDDLNEHQPDVLSYLMLTLDEQRTEAGMRACHLGWCVYRAFQLAFPEALPKVSIELLVQKAHQNEGLIQEAASTSQAAFMNVMSLEMANQPVVLDFVRRCAADVMTDDPAQNRKVVQEVVTVFLAVKSVVDAFDAATDSVLLETDLLPGTSRRRLDRDEPNLN